MLMEVRMQWVTWEHPGTCSILDRPRSTGVILPGKARKSCSRSTFHNQRSRNEGTCEDYRGRGKGQQWTPSKALRWSFIIASLGLWVYLPNLPNHSLTCHSICNGREHTLSTSLEWQDVVTGGFVPWILLLCVCVCVLWCWLCVPSVDKISEGKSFCFSPSLFVYYCIVLRMAFGR